MEYYNIYRYDVHAFFFYRFFIIIDLLLQTCFLLQINNTFHYQLHAESNSFPYRKWN